MSLGNLPIGSFVVIVPKEDKIHIWIDKREANKAITRTWHLKSTLENH